MIRRGSSRWRDAGAGRRLGPTAPPRFLPPPSVVPPEPSPQAVDPWRGPRATGLAILLLLGLVLPIALLAAALVWAFGLLVGVLGGSALLAVGWNVAQWYVFKRLKRVDRYTLFRAKHRLRAARGKGLPVAELARRCDLPEAKLRNHQLTYRAAEIPKPGGGVRRLSIPDAATLELQRTLLRRVLAKLHADPAACGFEKGKGVVDHAAPHVGRAVVITCDLADFFPSVTPASVDYLFRRVGWDAEAAALLTRLTTHPADAAPGSDVPTGLPQGAPTSPRLSNLLMHGVDYALAQAAARRGFRYTRYADDLAFSGEEDDGHVVRDLLRVTDRVVRRAGFRLHPRKTRVLRRHQRQVICGVVVNDKLNLPRETRRRLRATLHRRRSGGRPTLSDEQLAGWAGVLAMVARGPRGG